MTLEELFRHTCQSLPALEARLLMQKAYDLTRMDFLRDPTRDLDPQKLVPLVKRRLAHEPIAYLLGTQEFYGLEFDVSPATLIPRADSETVVDTALTFLHNHPAPFLLDLGTGSGALLLTLLHHLKNAFGIGVDFSWDALQIARQNALKLKVDASFMQGSWAQALQGSFDLILSNPPYIPRGEIAFLQPDVKDYEPHLALDGGETGLDDYRLILAQAAPLLRKNGLLLFEIGQGQAEDIFKLAATHYNLTHHIQDLNGIIRVLGFQLKQEAHLSHQ